MQKVVLIVEDHDRQTWWYRNALEAAGVTVFTAASLASGRTLIEEHPEANLIILDGVLPETDGGKHGREISVLPLIEAILAMRGDDVYLVAASDEPRFGSQMVSAGCNIACYKEGAATMALHLLGIST